MLYHFENFWIKMPGFKETVLNAWNEENPHTEPLHRLNFKLQTTASRLKEWSRNLLSETKLQLHMALDVILQLDKAQENRVLIPDELELRKKLKQRVLGLSVLERARKRQASRITNIKLGDANTKYFHLKVNSRRRKNFIHKLRRGNGWAVSQTEKMEVAEEHFQSIMSTPPLRRVVLN